MLKPMISNVDGHGRGAHPKCVVRRGRIGWLAVLAALWAVAAMDRARGADSTDPVLGLLLEKGVITQDEAARAEAQMAEMRTNEPAPRLDSKWKISSGIKDIELYGDLRLRYEDRAAHDPAGGKIDLRRYRYAARVGLRGDLADDFYYGFRMETSANPRSSMVTFGTSASGNPYSGPFGKSNAGLDVGQIYVGWKPESWLDVTAGKMPNPFYTSTMVWSPSIDPEGLAEHFKHTVGEADFFANFGQLVYVDTSPYDSGTGYFTPALGSDHSVGGSPFMLAWQGGVNYHLTKTLSFKVAPALYSYDLFNNGQSPNNNASGFTPDFSGTYVGQGSTVGVGNATAYYNLANGTPGFDGYYANQTGINNLLVLEIPFELNLALDKMDMRLFGDYVQNLDGGARAEAAYEASHSTYFTSLAPNLSPIASPQTQDDKAYQIGLAVGSKDALGLVNGTTAKRHAWELRTYWQHVEQYSLDPNLLDLDFFSGAENLQGVYAAAAYGFTDNFIGTFRYGYARRINNQLGTGGAGTDIPQMNPIDQFDLFQVDLTFKF